MKYSIVLLNVLDTLGWILYRSGAYRSAVETLKECVAMQPKNSLFNYHLGMSYHKVGDKPKAKASLLKALELNPKFDGANNARSILATL
jgi:Flp pilus assembly protein TadD